MVNHSVSSHIFKKLIDHEKNYNKKSNSFVMDVKVISNILKCTTQEFGKIKLKKLQWERLDEIYAKSNEDLERVKLCLENINDIEIKKYWFY